MSQFYGTIDGQAKTQATRRGSVNSRLITHAAGWKGAVRVELYQDENGRDCFDVELVPWQNSGGKSVRIARGYLEADNENALDCVS